MGCRRSGEPVGAADPPPWGMGECAAGCLARWEIGERADGCPPTNTGGNGKKRGGRNSTAHQNLQAGLDSHQHLLAQTHAVATVAQSRSSGPASSAALQSHASYPSTSASQQWMETDSYVQQRIRSEVNRQMENLRLNQRRQSGSSTWASPSQDVRSGSGSQRGGGPGQDGYPAYYPTKIGRAHV